MVVAAPDSLNVAVGRASAILGADPAGARREAEAILRSAPKDPRALLVLASASRRLGDPAAALAVLRPLAAAYPRAAHTHYELGAALAAGGDSRAAISALRHAVSLKRDLAPAWRALGDLLFATGDEAGARAAFAEHDRAVITDPALAPAADAIFADRIADAEDRLRAHLQARPDDPAALRLMAEVYGRLDRWGDAETLLARAIELQPNHDGARFSYATALFRQQKAAEAILHVEGLLARHPGEPPYRNLMAACLGLAGEFEREIALYEGLLAEFPRQPRIWLNYGHALRTVGRAGDAVAAYKRAIALAPDLGDAYWSLANLKTAPFSPDEEAAMASQLARPDLDPDDRLHLHYALGKAFEDRDEPAASFEHYARGATLRRAAVVWDADAHTAQVARAEAIFTPAFFAARRGAGSPATDPIFIVGLPRSGSTLIEQILASHSAVEGVMELPDLDIIARGLGASEAYPAVLANLERPRLTRLGEIYLDRTRSHRKLGRPLFIDKMPNNFRHIGLIHLILPGARIIDARRHPLATGFSAFKQHFAQGQSFSYDLTDLGRYYRDYVRLMAHVDAVLPDRVHRVIYEDLVEDTEAEVRRLLSYCGLEFEVECLKFHENRRAVRTVSSEQVRRPIFRGGLEQWRNYEPWLEPLKAALGPVLEDWRGA